VKLLFLTIGELWHYSEDTNQVLKARQCISAVQVLSKWACPDLFVYVLLLFLIRHLDNTAVGGGLFSTTLHAPAHVDIGFTCFALFCILSTVAALMIKVPEIEGEESPATAVVLPSWWVTAVRSKGVGFFAVPLAGGSLICLCVGMAIPCMGLRLNADSFIEPHGPIPKQFKAMIDGMNIPEHVNADVSLFECAKALFHWTREQSEFNDMLALTLLIGFVFALTVLDVIALLAAVFSVQADTAMRVSHVLRHLSMLDVCATGVIMVSSAGAVYEEQGITLFLLPGIYLLVIAEVFHYVLYYTISAATEKSREENSELKLGARDVAALSSMEG